MNFRAGLPSFSTLFTRPSETLFRDEARFRVRARAPRDLAYVASSGGNISQTRAGKGGPFDSRREQRGLLHRGGSPQCKQPRAHKKRLHTTPRRAMRFCGAGDGLHVFPLTRLKLQQSGSRPREFFVNPFRIPRSRAASLAPSSPRTCRRSSTPAKGDVEEVPASRPCFRTCRPADFHPAPSRLHELPARNDL